MRLGVLSDIHGNLAALESAVAALRRLGVDRWVCSGDLVGYGPYPNECVAVVAGLDAVCVVGNHDLMALGVLPSDRRSPLVRETQAWTRRELDEAARGFLGALPVRATLDDVVVAHGSLDDPDVYVRTAEAAAGELDALAELEPAARVLVIGHTHRPLVVPEGGRARRVLHGGRVRLGARRSLLNPGAVGQSRVWEPRPRARALLLDTATGEARFVVVGYDVEATRRALRRRGLSPAALSQPPARRRMLRSLLVGRGRGPVG